MHGVFAHLPSRSGRLMAAVVLSLALLPAAVPAQDDAKPAVTGRNAKIQFSGVGWVTYRYLLADEPGAAAVGSALSAPGVDRQDLNTFDVDRVYVTADYVMNETFSWQSIVEAENLSGTPRIFLKRAFVRAKSPFGLTGTGFRFGQIAHVYTPVAEDAWGYRIVSKIPVDRYLGISTTWVGAGLDGKVLGDVLDFDAAVTNENAYNRSSGTKYKSLQGRATITPLPGDEVLKGLHLTGFAQYNAKPQPAGFEPGASDNNNVWFGLLPYFKNDRLSAGVEFLQRRDKHSVAGQGPDETGVETVTAQYLGGFATIELAPDYRAFLRLDQFDPNTDVDDNGSLTFIGGLSHTYSKGIRSILDLEYTTFDEGEGESLDADLTVAARMEISL